MKTLFLIRHAKSSWDDTALPDKDRPLNDRGKRDAPKMGKRLAKSDVKPDLILSSPAMPLWHQLTWWTLAFPLVMIVAILRHDIFLLNWIHVLSGGLWTGADLFMGFILGPVLRMLDMGARTALIAYLVPRTLLYFPMVSLTAGTAGWFLADWLGFTAPASPMFHLTLISLALVAVMTVIGLGFLLPNSLRIWWELRQPEPNRERIVRINGINIWLAGSQGLLQIVIILVMAKYVS